MNLKTEKVTAYLPELVGKGYGEFWRSTKRYRVVKGSRASKKSTTAALWCITKLMEYPLANLLVVRKVYSSLRDSCFATLKWAINRLGVTKYWKAKSSPLELEYLPTGQKILFRGLNEPMSLTSITVAKGYLCWCMIEEAYQIDEEDFKIIEGSFRGKMPEGYFINFTLLFNPWDVNSWLKSRFFDKPDKDVLAMTTTYKCNEWLSAADIKYYEKMRKIDPERYKIEGEGDWGLAAGQFFKEWKSYLHVVKPFSIPASWIKFRAMDWGMSRPSAVLWLAVDYDGNIYVYRELYTWSGKPNEGSGETAAQVARKIIELEKSEEKISYGVLDSACWTRNGVTTLSIAEVINDELCKAGLTPFGKSTKGRVEGANAIKQRLIGNETAEGNKPALYFFANCFHSIRTIPMLGYDKHNPETYDTQGEDHCFIAGTMIETKRGEIPIEEVTTKDFVLTRKGFRKVLAAELTKKNADVMTVKFSNGKSLTGTANHPIFLKGKGFCTLDTVKYGDIILGVSEVKNLCRESSQNQRIPSCLTELNLDAIQIQNAKATEGIIEQAEIIESRAFATCTGKYGNFTTEKYLKDVTFIIKTEIFLIMIFLILNCLKELNIYRNTQESIWKMKILEIVFANIWKLSEKKLLNGINQRKGESGTDSKVLNARKSNHQNLKLNWCVLSVVKNFLHQATEEIKVNFVQKPVTQNTDETTELMTKREFVQSVEKNIVSTNFLNKKLVVQENVVYAVCSTVEQRKADVYNLTVDEEHEYFANGFLVHNCVDALSYGLLSRPFKPTKPEEIKHRERYKHEEKFSVWNY